MEFKSPVVANESDGNELSAVMIVRGNGEKSNPLFKNWVGNWPANAKPWVCRLRKCDTVRVLHASKTGASAVSLSLTR